MKNTRSANRWPLLVFVAAVAVAPAVHAQAGFDKMFAPDTIGTGSVSTLTFNISNAESPTPISALAFSDTLPAGVTIAAPANATSSCGGTLTAPNGGSTITFGDGTLGSNSSCSISVDVTSSTPGQHMNVSSDLTSSAGNSGPAAADLNVDASQPGLTKSFSPDSVNLGSRSTLTFTVDNIGAGSAAVTFLDFTDNLPVGMVVADPTNRSTTCAGGTIAAVPGSSSVSFFATSIAPPVVGALDSCSVSVDVVATGIGLLGNTSGQLTFQRISDQTQMVGGKAAAVLEVTRDPISLVKSFIDDPVPPGATLDIQFRITNFDRNFAATGITFTDDLDAVLTGLVAVGLPAADVCGAGSQLTGTVTLSLTGGTLGPGESCTFTATLQVPAVAAGGAYINTTSSITADVDGNGVISAPGQDILFISTVPILTKEFTDDPIGGGGTVNLRFTITNIDQDPASDIAFTDELTTFLPFPLSVSPPAPGFCGGGSTISVIGTAFNGQAISVSGASLAGGASCMFDVGVDIPVGFPNGIYPNLTSEITATVGGETLTGAPAADDLVVVAAPRLGKQFTDDPAVPGGTVTLEFTITNGEEAPGDATAITFTDDLAASIPGLTATLPPLPDPPCGVGSSLTGSAGDTLLTFAGGTLTPGEVCTFSVTLNVPVGATPGSFPNTTSNLGAKVLGVTTEGAPATDDLRIAGLLLTKEFIDDPAVPGGTTTLRFTIDNVSPVSDATAIIFTDNLTSTLSGLAAPGPLTTGTCDGSLAGTMLLIYSGGSLMAGQSCSFDVTLDVPAGATSDTYVNTTQNFAANFGGGSVPLDNASDKLVVAEQKVSLAKRFTDDPVNVGGTVTLEFEITNESPTNAASSIAFTDDLNAALAGLMATGALGNDCGGMAISAFPTGLFEYAGGSLAAGASCTITLSVDVPASAAAGSYLNTTSSVTADIDGNATTGDPASDTLTVVGRDERPVDYGDAPTGGPAGAPPDSYPTLFAQDGARHVVAAGAPTLGRTIDADPDGQPNATATGDDVNVVYAGVPFPAGDEDGVTFTQLVYTASTTATTGTVDVDLQNANPTQNLLNAWIDFNRDGDWDDSGEQIFTDFDLGTSNGVQSLTFSIPAVVGANVVAGVTFARFRLSTVAGLTPRGEAPDGEVEDHTLTLALASPLAFSKDFAPGTIASGGVSTLTFTIDNSADVVAATNLSFIDNLPAGVVIAAPTNASTTCAGGMGNASPGAASFSFAGGTVAAGATCTVRFDVTSGTATTYVNTTGDLTSSLGNSGTASAALVVTVIATDIPTLGPAGLLLLPMLLTVLAYGYLRRRGPG